MYEWRTLRLKANTGTRNFSSHILIRSPQLLRIWASVNATHTVTLISSIHHLSKPKGVQVLKFGLIGSTGLTPTEFLTDVRSKVVSTTCGSVNVNLGQVGEREIICLTRSDPNELLPPHRVNYSANILALKKLNVRHVLATSIVGSLTTQIKEGSFLILDQFIDFTKQRELTLFADGEFSFVDMTDPYCRKLRSTLLESSISVVPDVHPVGCYVGVDGPRYETRAEIEMYRRLGGDVIGMTNVPEVVMAREAGLCYAAVAYVSNLGAGLSVGPVNLHENVNSTLRNVPKLQAILKTAFSRLIQDDDCSCRSTSKLV